MSTRLYKNGKLTTKAKQKLQKRLQKENQKPKVSNSKAAKTKKATPKTIQPVPVKLEEEVTTELVVKPTEAPKKRPMPKKASELTMDDIPDTPRNDAKIRQRYEAMNENKDVNWISLIGYNQIQAENEEKLYAKLNHQCNATFKNDLDAQITIKKQQKKEAQSELAAYRNALNTQFKSYKTEDERKLAAKHAETLKLKEIREEQVVQSEMKRKYEQLKRKKHELREVQKLKLALEKEKREKKEKKEKNMAKLKDMLIDNERQKALKESERARERESERARERESERARERG